MSLKTFLALLAGFALGLIAATSIHELLAAGERSKVKRSAADARTISDAIERYRQTNGRYPPIGRDLAQLAPALVPPYLKSLPARDVYGEPYLLLMDGSVPVVVSTGRNGFAFERGEMIAKGPAFPAMAPHPHAPSS